MADLSWRKGIATYRAGVALSAKTVEATLEKVRRQHEIQQLGPEMAKGLRNL